MWKLSNLDAHVGATSATSATSFPQAAGIWLPALEQPQTWLVTQ